MSYHIESHDRLFHELPDRILVREDGYLSAYKFEGKPIVDYWYVPESDYARMRDLAVGLLVCDMEDADARVTCPLYDDGEPNRCRKARLLRELGLMPYEKPKMAESLDGIEVNADA